MRKFVYLMVFGVLLISPAWGDLRISETNFPDDVFREYVSENFDIDNNGELNTSEIDAVSKIELSGKLIETPEGIRFFTELKYLDCESNALTSLNLSNMRKLERLDCSYNGINELNLSNCSNLRSLSCSYNNLSQINLEAFPKLSLLHCSYNI